MTKESLAAMLEGRESGDEITPEECRLAKDAGLLVVFGASDDLMELRGAIDDEVSAYDEGDAFIYEGALLHEIDDDDENALEKHGVLGIVKERFRTAIHVRALWSPEGSQYAWIMKTEAPHAEFNICEDGERWCLGVVIDLKK